MVCIYTNADPLQNESPALKIQRRNNSGVFDDAFVSGFGQLILTEKNLCVPISTSVSPGYIILWGGYGRASG